MRCVIELSVACSIFAIFSRYKGRLIKQHELVHLQITDQTIQSTFDRLYYIYHMYIIKVLTHQYVSVCVVWDRTCRWNLCHRTYTGIVSPHCGPSDGAAVASGTQIPDHKLYSWTWCLWKWLDLKCEIVIRSTVCSFCTYSEIVKI